MSVRFGRAKSTTHIRFYAGGDLEIDYEDWFYDDGSYHPLFWFHNFRSGHHLSVDTATY